MEGSIFFSRFKSSKGRVLAEGDKDLYRVTISGYGIPQNTIIDFLLPDLEAVSGLAQALHKATWVEIHIAPTSGESK